jgi:hypothetical protein
MAREASKKVSYETLYEEWLLKSVKAKNGPRNDEIDEFVSTATCTTARAGLEASLQCALLDGTDDIQALAELFNQTLWETDGEAAARVEILLPLLKASDDDKGTAMKNAADPLKDHGTADIDAFFDDHPKCVRQDWEDSESDESDDEEVQPLSKKVATFVTSTFERPAQPSLPRHLDDEVLVEKVQQSQSDFSYTESAPVAAPQNPYAQQRNNFQSALPPPPMQQRKQATGSRYSTWEQSNNNNSYSWDDFRSQQNPFQTARELAQAAGGGGVGGGENNDSPQGSDYRSMNQQHQHNPYARPPQPESQQFRPQSIPDSLKRKFQPPKRGT